MIPLFVIAPMNRSGTNYLREILLCHSEVHRSFCYEDYSLAYTSDMLSFVDKMAKHWGPKHRHARDELVTEISDAICRFFAKDVPAGRYVLLTTPRAWGVANVFDVYANAKVLFLVRDGRNTVASACKSFKHGGFAYWSRQWRDGAKCVLAFSRQFHATCGDSWDVVQYEDLNKSAQNTILSLLSFLKLDADKFDWERFSQLPLWGSSDHGVGQKAKRPDGFKNDERYLTWSPWQKWLFEAIAGKTNRLLHGLAAQKGGAGVS